MSVWDGIGEFLAKAGDLLSRVISRAIDFGKDIVPDVRPKPPGSGGTVPTTPGGGGGSPGDGSPGPPGGAFTGVFSEPITFLRHLTEGRTWVRVGLVLIGILLIVLAVRMMSRPQNPIEKTMNAIGIR